MFHARSNSEVKPAAPASTSDRSRTAQTAVRPRDLVADSQPRIVRGASHRRAPRRRRDRSDRRSRTALVSAATRPPQARRPHGHQSQVVDGPSDRPDRVGDLPMVVIAQDARGTPHRPRTPMFREIDQRRCAGLIVTLEWDSDTDQVQVRCEDEHTPPGPPLCYPVEPGAARIAFLHPFAFRPREGTNSTGDMPRTESDEAPARRRRRWYRPWSKPKRGSVTEANDVPWPWPLP
jgi:hypothetical protein